MPNFESTNIALENEAEKTKEYYQNFVSLEEIEEGKQFAQESESGGDLAELMDKYGREEWELVDLAKQCEDFLNYEKAPRPLKDPAQMQELAIFYREYLAAKSSDGLPFSEAERTPASPKYREFLSAASADGLPFSEAERKYIPAQYLDELATWRVEENKLCFRLAEINNGAASEAKDPLLKPITGLSEYDSIRTKLGIRQKKINQREEAMISLVSKSGGGASKPEFQKLSDEWENVPEYSSEDLRIMETSLAWLKNRRLPRPIFSNGENLSEAQILESAQEGAEYKGLLKGYFSVAEEGGRRVLVNRQTFLDEEKKVNKQIKYSHASHYLPAGEYYFEIDSESFSIGKNNPNLAMAKAPFMLRAESPRKTGAEKTTHESQATGRLVS